MELTQESMARNKADLIVRLIKNAREILTSVQDVFEGVLDLDGLCETIKMEIDFLFEDHVLAGCILEEERDEIKNSFAFLLEEASEFNKKTSFFKNLCQPATRTPVLAS